MEKPYKIVKLDSPKDIELLDNLLVLLFSKLQEIRHRVSTTTPVASQLQEGEIIFLDDGVGDRQLYAKIKDTLFRLPKITTDGVLAGNSDKAIPTEKAVKTYVDAKGYFRRDPEPTDWEYEVGDLTTDATWNDLDLSSIVPAGARAVHLLVQIADGVADSHLAFRCNGNSGIYEIALLRTQVANIVNDADLIVKCDGDRKIQYEGSNLTFSMIQIVVKGWWI